MLISTLSSPSAHTYTNPHASSARRMPYSIRHSFSSSKSSFPPGSAALQQPCGHVPSPSPLRLLVACHAKRKRSSKDGPAAESSSGIDFSHFDTLAAKPEHRGIRVFGLSFMIRVLSFPFCINKLLLLRNSFSAFN